MIFSPSEIQLEISGLGIIFYSPAFTEHIPAGFDYLRSNYTTVEQVQSHVQAGSIVGFATGSPGTYILRFREGYPDKSQLSSFGLKLRLGLNCRGGIVCFRDLYDLMDWEPHCPPNQSLQLTDGCYHVTLCSNLPASGIRGDNQVIEVYMQPLEAFPELANNWIPTLT